MKSLTFAATMLSMVMATQASLFDYVYDTTWKGGECLLPGDRSQRGRIAWDPMP